MAEPEQKTPTEEKKQQAAPPAARTSKGEKLFDWLTYGGIGFAGVFVATMPWTYWTKYGNGRKFHDWMTTALKNRGASEHVAEQTFNTAVLGSLGNAAVIPIKLLENKKPEIVDKLNDMLGETTNASSVDAEPKQSWVSLVTSRVAAYAAVFFSLQGAVSIFGGEKFKHFEEKFAEAVVCKPLGKPTHTPGLAKIAANETKAFRYGKIAALDVFATAAATVLLYLGSRVFAKKNETWKLPPGGQPEVAPQLGGPATPAAAIGVEVHGLDPADAEARRFTDTIHPRKHQAQARPGHEKGYAETVAGQKARNEGKLPGMPA